MENITVENIRRHECDGRTSGEAGNPSCCSYLWISRDSQYILQASVLQKKISHLIRTITSIISFSSTRTTGFGASFPKTRMTYGNSPLKTQLEGTTAQPRIRNSHRTGVNAGATAGMQPPSSFGKATTTIYGLRATSQKLAGLLSPTMPSSIHHLSKAPPFLPFLWAQMRAS